MQVCAVCGLSTYLPMYMWCVVGLNWCVLWCVVVWPVMGNLLQGLLTTLTTTPNTKAQIQIS